jgi:hypothetical protein
MIEVKIGTFTIFEDGKPLASFTISLTFCHSLNPDVRTAGCFALAFPQAKSGGRNVRLSVENFGGRTPATCAPELVRCELVAGRMRIDGSEL